MGCWRWSINYAPIPRYKVSVVLQFYIDESGMDPNEPFDFVVVAGFWAEEEEWKSFNIQWAKCLDKFGLLAFHMTDFLSAANGTPIEGKNEKRLKPYKNWSAADFRECLDRFVGVIEEFGPKGFSWQLPRDEYVSILSDEVREAYDPYVLLADYTYSKFDASKLHGIIGAYDRRIRDEKLAIFFGCTNKKLEAAVKKRHEMWRRTNFGQSHLISDGPRFVLANQSEFIPVQAADVLANLSRGYFRGQAHPHVARVGMTPYVRRLFKVKRILHHTISRKQLYDAQGILEAEIKKAKDGERSNPEIS
jgi:hypothetical protein